MTTSIACDGPLPQATHRRRALGLVIGAGVVSAFQVGKATLMLASIGQDLGVTLAAASWVLSAFALVGAAISLPIGAVADRFPARRTVIAGLLLQATGSALGAMAPGLAWLLAARALEGVGFLAVTVAAPVLVVASTTPHKRKRAFAAWATFMPVGMAIVMFAAPMLGQLGWRGLWWINAALLAGYAAFFATGTHALPHPPRQAAHDGWLHGMRETLAAREAWFLAGQLFAYTAVFFALFGFLPTILADRLDVGDALSGVLAAVAVAAGAAGCLACGTLLQRGHGASRLLMAGFTIMAMCSVGALAVPLPGVVAYTLCVLFSFAGAFVPVVIFDAAPRLSASPQVLGSIVGLATQGNHLGIVVGPAVAGAIAGAGGWAWVAVAVALPALPAAWTAHLFRRRLEAAR